MTGATASEEKAAEVLKNLAELSKKSLGQAAAEAELRTVLGGDRVTRAIRTLRSTSLWLVIGYVGLILLFARAYA